VLCFGDNGHIYVEEAINGKCNNCFIPPIDTDNQSSLYDAVELNGDSCDPCLDIPLPTINHAELLAPSRHSSIPNQISFPLYYSYSTLAFSLIPSEDFYVVHNSAICPILTSLRTVTILI